ncbi:MAG TPA: ABC-2 family transporter protein [Catenuloplanes sp.]|jgi:ABC-2 type transport system permease protein
MLGGQFRSLTSYRASFAVEVATNLGVASLDVLTVLVLFRVTRTIGGFELREAVVVVGLSACAFAAADLVVGNVDQLKRYVRTGLLDAILVRPLGVLPQLIAMDPPLRKVSRVLVSAGVLVTAVTVAGIDWNVQRVLLLIATPLLGMVFFGSIFVGSASLAFWWVESGEVGAAFTYGGRDFTAYPIPVYSGWFRAVFAYGLGFGFVAYYPALALLGRPDPLGLPSWVGWVSPLVAVPAAGAAAAAWRVGLRQYRSTGS